MDVFLQIKNDAVFHEHQKIELSKKEAKFIKLDERIVADPDLLKFFEMQKERLWTDNELPVDEEDITKNFINLSQDFKTLIFSILLFFTVADKLVMSNLDKLKSSIPYKSVSNFFNIQNYIETIHDKVYEKIAKLYYFEFYGNYRNYLNDQKLIELFLEESEKRPDMIFDIDNYESEYYNSKTEEEKKIFKAAILKINLMNKWKNEDSVIVNLVAFFIIEGVSFNALFAVIETMKENNSGVKYMAEINKFVSKDEKIHTDFGFFLYTYYLENHLEEDEFMYILRDISEVEIEFLNTILPNDIYGKSKEEYINYTKTFSNGFSQKLFDKKLYLDTEAVKYNFEKSFFKTSTNFFERVSIYNTDTQGPLKISDLF